MTPEIADTVPADAPCRRCYYDLRGLPMNGQCPECGLAVSASVGPRLLRYADPVWVQRLRLGARCAAWGLATMVIAPLVLLAVGWLQVVAGLPYWVARPYPVLHWGGRAAFVFGAWLLVMPEPGQDREAWPARVGRIGLIGMSAYWGMRAIPRPVWSQWTTFCWWENGAGVMLIAWAIGSWALLHHLSGLARRIPDDVLADRADTAMYGVGTPLAVNVGIDLLLMVPYTLGWRAVIGNPASRMAYGISDAALAIFSLFTAYVLARFARRLAGMVTAVPEGS